MRRLALQVVDYLLQEGAKPNEHDKFGIAPIHKAVGHGQARTTAFSAADECNRQRRRTGEGRGAQRRMVVS